MSILNKGKPTHRHARIPRRIRTPLAALAVAVCMAAAPAWWPRLLAALILLMVGVMLMLACLLALTRLMALAVAVFDHPY